MSKKIYREVQLQWNDDTQSFDTIYEDSYDYDGPMDYAQGDMDDFDFRELGEVMKDLGKTLEKSMKKAVRSGASEYKKRLVLSRLKSIYYLQSNKNNFFIFNLHQCYQH